MTDSLTSDYFHGVYANRDDPWDFESSPYEQGKYARTLQELPRAHYGSAFEIGCSIGVLTEQLGQRCDLLLSVDVSDRALEKARQRCRDLPQVRFQEMRVPWEFPNARFDLVLVSEVAYYFSLPDLDLLADRIASVQQPGSDLVLVHFTPLVPDYPLTGDAVHDRFLERKEWEHLSGTREERYRLDAFRRRAE